MASTKIQNLPLKAPIGAMKIPTGGFGDYSITVSSIGDYIIDTFNLATKDYVDNLLIEKEDRIDTTGGFLTPVSQNSSVPDTTNDVIDEVAQALLDRIEYVKDNFSAAPSHNELTGRSATGAHPSTSISHKSGTVYTYLQQNESDINNLNNVSIPTINQALLNKQDLIETDGALTPVSTQSPVPSVSHTGLNTAIQALLNRTEWLKNNNNVKSVNSKTGDVVLTPSDISTTGNNNLTPTPSLVDVPELLDKNGVRDSNGNAQAQALLNNFSYLYNANAMQFARSVSKLRQLIPIYQNSTAITASYYDDGNTGSNIFVWNSESTETDNGYSIIEVDGVTTGRWIAIEGYKINSHQIGAKSDVASQGRFNNISDLFNKTIEIIGTVLIDDTLNINKSYATFVGVGTNSTILYNGPDGTANTLSERKPIIKIFNDNGSAISQTLVENLTVQMNYKQFCTGVDARYFTTQSRMKDIIIRGVSDNSVGILINKSWYAEYKGIFISGYNPTVTGRHGTGVLLESTLGDGGQLNALNLGISCHTLNTGYLINPTNYIYALNINTSPTIENCDIGIKCNTVNNDYQVRQSVITAYFENNGIDIQWGDPSTSVTKNSKHTWLGCSFDDVLSRVELYQGHHTFIGCKGIKTLVVGQYAQVEFINTPRPSTVADPYSNATFRQDPLSQITAGSYQTVNVRAQGLHKQKGTISSGSTVTFDIASALNSSIAAEGQTGEIRITSRRSYDTSLLVYNAILLRKTGGNSYLVPDANNSSGLTVSISGTILTVTDVRGDTRFVDLTFRPD
nr:tailspike protein [Acinetobacter phage 3073a-K32]